MVSNTPSSQNSSKSLKSNFESPKEQAAVNQKPSRTWSVWGHDKVEIDDTANPTAEGNSRANNDEGRKDPKSTDSQGSIRSVQRQNQNPEGPRASSPQSRGNSPQGIVTQEQGGDKGSKNRTWFFWGRRVNNEEESSGSSEVERVIPAAGGISHMSNKIVPYSSSDAILFKSKSDSEIIDEGSSQMVAKQNPNIVVPSFDILPRQTAWTSISASISRIAHNWHLLSSENNRRKCLYQKGPEENLQKLSNGGRNAIKVLIVGVHGFFPTKMIRPFIGEPTGTSVKFVSEAEEVVLKYFQKHKRPIEISKIALEREGEVLDRVDFFFDVMKNWVKEINQADFIYFVAHSQGCPVTILLLSRLIDTGIINLDNTRFFNADDVPFSSSKKIISILAMAGINNGPFYGADQTLFVRAYQTIEKESLRELFQFQKFDSMLSKLLLRSIRVIIGSGVKITFVGSINDQLVPLYSSTCLFASHPNMFRATFIDKGSRTPAFITRLLNIAGTLLDLGFDDHGIIKEISSSLAGTLTGGGHSTVYNEAQVYELGLRFALETTDVSEDIPVEFKPFKLEQLGSNPYHLPWCMRGLLYETNEHLDPEEIHRLFEEFEEWEPDTKQLKDVKYRLNGLKSKL